MRLLLLAKSTTAHGFGGMETHADTFAATARELGHEVALLTTAHPGGLAREVRGGVRVEYLSGAPPACYSRAWWALSRAAVQRELAQGFGDLLLSFSLAGYGAASARLPVRHFAFAYGEAWLHLMSGWHEWRGLRGAASYAKHALATLYYAALERRLWRRLDGVVATYDDLYRRLRRRGVPAHLSYNPIEPRQFAPDPQRREAARATLGIAPEAPVLLMVSAVNRQKGVWLGVECFLALAARRPDLHLVVVGDGPDLERLRSEVAGRGRSGRVHFAGAAGRQGMPVFFAAADLFLYPTLRMEGLPLAILEAMAAGLPVVASRRGGITSAVKHEETGLLVSPGDVGALVESLGRLLADPALARSLGKRAQEWVGVHAEPRRLTARLLGEIAPGGGRQ
jgi:glycosyltransferase involved in cell wall biosynthesis